MSHFKRILQQARFSMPKNKGSDSKAAGKAAHGKVVAGGAKQNGQKIKIRHILW